MLEQEKQNGGKKHLLFFQRTYGLDTSTHMVAYNHYANPSSRGSSSLLTSEDNRYASGS